MRLRRERPYMFEPAGKSLILNAYVFTACNRIICIAVFSKIQCERTYEWDMATDGRPTEKGPLKYLIIYDQATGMQCRETSIPTNK